MKLPIYPLIGFSDFLAEKCSHLLTAMPWLAQWREADKRRLESRVLGARVGFWDAPPSLMEGLYLSKWRIMHRESVHSSLRICPAWVKPCRASECKLHGLAHSTWGIQREQVSYVLGLAPNEIPVPAHFAWRMGFYTVSDAARHGRALTKQSNLGPGCDSLPREACWVIPRSKPTGAPSMKTENPNSSTKNLPAFIPAIKAAEKNNLDI